MKPLALSLIAVSLIVPNTAWAQPTKGLPLSASNCAIAQALHMNLPENCIAPDLGEKRGIVIRLDKELMETSSAPKTHDITVNTTPQTVETTISKDHAAAESENGYFIHFAFNSFQLEPQFKEHLGRLASVLNGDALATSCLRVTGHTDAVGDANYNNELSEKRAVMVASFLSEIGSIDPTRIQVIGMGEESLLPDLKGTDARNRRVEFATKDSLSGCSKTK